MYKIYFLIFIHYLIAMPAIAEPSDRRAAMADAMLNMMESFGMFGDQASIRNNIPQILNNPNLPWANWQAGINNELNGTWLGNSGERLQIQNTNFYLQATDGRQISGILKVRERILALHQPRYNITMLYEYALQDHRLALRDRMGNLLLYRRIP